MPVCGRFLIGRCPHMENPAECPLLHDRDQAPFCHRWAKGECQGCTSRHYYIDTDDGRRRVEVAGIKTEPQYLRFSPPGYVSPSEDPRVAFEAKMDNQRVQARGQVPPSAPRIRLVSDILPETPWEREDRLNYERRKNLHEIKERDLKITSLKEEVIKWRKESQKNKHEIEGKNKEIKMLQEIMERTKEDFCKQMKTKSKIDVETKTKYMETIRKELEKLEKVHKGNSGLSVSIQRLQEENKKLKESSKSAVEIAVRKIKEQAAKNQAREEAASAARQAAVSQQLESVQEAMEAELSRSVQALVGGAQMDGGQEEVAGLAGQLEDGVSPKTLLPSVLQPSLRVLPPGYALPSKDPLITFQAAIARLDMEGPSSWATACSLARPQQEDVVWKLQDDGNRSGAGDTMSASEELSGRGSKRSRCS